ncbi:hypothetical protein B0H14DRAFT_2635369 [Mycena olivaceomarginata]|nr:hypothetical protein B0H14DRAFT_2635369 [Mycena olivaceomarginata]
MKTAPPIFVVVACLHQPPSLRGIRGRMVPEVQILSSISLPSRSPSGACYAERQIHPLADAPPSPVQLQEGITASAVARTRALSAARAADAVATAAGGWGSTWATGGGGWDGGWDNGAAVVHKRCRIPRPRGYHRMGMIFLPPRVVGRQDKQREMRPLSVN